MTRFGVGLDQYRALSIAALDAGAEAFRMRFITPGAGQALAYMTKLKEASDYLGLPEEDITPAEFPHLVQEAAVDGMTLHQKAQQITNIAFHWGQVSSLIDATRLQKKQAIDVAETAAEIRQILDFSWESILV